MTKIDVLDKGYVRLVDHMGNDLRIVNAARVSYDKASTNWGDRDASLLNFLMREGHTSVLRHASLTFECYAPLMVARQWYKHAVGSTYLEDQNGWNESSRRYVTENEEFYLPRENEWRSKPANSKQGSGEPIDLETAFHYMNYLDSYQKQGLEWYTRAMECGIAPELARLFLPANGLYVRYYWTTSLAALIHFLNLRDESHAQYEIQLYAKALRELAEPIFPETFKAVFGEQLGRQWVEESLGPLNKTLDEDWTGNG
jgi:thymidylate synthase (FAD)